MTLDEYALKKKKKRVVCIGNGCAQSMWFKKLNLAKIRKGAKGLDQQVESRMQ